MLARRRDFLWGVGAVAAMSFAAPALRGEDRPAASPIIDAHQHLWNLDKFHLPWLDRAGPLLKRNYSMDDYVKAAEGLNVTAAVYMEVAVAPEQQAAEADEVIGLCERKIGPMVAAVIGGRPESDGFRDYIVRFKGNRFVKGVRSSFPKDGATNAQFHESLKLLGELGMSYDLLLDNSLLPQAVKAVEACPETRFILDHCGNASTKFYAAGSAKDVAVQDRRRAWEEGIAALAEKKHVICKISGVAESGTADDATLENVAPIVNHCLDRFAEERVVFASNWPVCLKAVTFARWVELAKKITSGRGEKFQNKLFHDNAERFYGLK
jgi:predicted TIM-barrel fold metal-dependent hydrolase